MKCPKCGTEIPRFDLSPNCKKCGVHIMYYTQEEDLRRDAKKTELEFATARFILAKIKSSFFTGKISLLKILFLLLSVASLLLPHYNLVFSFPWWNYTFSVSALGIYSIFKDSLLSVSGALSDIGAGTTLFMVTVCILAILIISAVITISCIVSWILSIVNHKKSAVACITFSIIGILVQFAGTVLSFIAVNLSGMLEFVTAKPFFGGLLSMLVFFGILVTSFSSLNNKPELKLKDADRQRLIIRSKLKRGELSIDDLPLPIVDEQDEPEAPKKKNKEKKK